MDTARLRIWASGFGIVLLTLVCGGLMLKVGKNAHALWRVQHDLADLEYAERKLAAEHAALHARIAELQSPEGMEATMREMGYVRPGDRPVRFIDPDTDPASTTPPPWPIRLQEATREILELRFGNRGSD